MGDLFNATGMSANERKARPLEAAACLFINEVESYVLLENVLRNEAVSRNIDPERELAAEAESKISEIALRLRNMAGALAKERRQFVQSERAKDEWASPSARGKGWLCPSAETGICEYTKDYDTCDHCGFPEERK